MPFIRNVSANYHGDKPSECNARHYTCMVHIGTYIALRLYRDSGLWTLRTAIYWSYTVVSAPIRLPLIPRLLTQSKRRFVHQNLPILDLHAWELSNNQSEIRNFRKTLQILSPDQEEHLHKKSTMQNGPSSLIGVIQKRLIQSRTLLQL